MFIKTINLYSAESHWCIMNREGLHSQSLANATARRDDYNFMITGLPETSLGFYYLVQDKTNVKKNVTLDFNI